MINGASIIIRAQDITNSVTLSHFVAMGQMSFQGAVADLDCVKVGWIARRNVADFYLLPRRGQPANALLLVFRNGDRFSLESGDQYGEMDRNEESDHA